MTLQDLIDKAEQADLRPESVLVWWGGTGACRVRADHAETRESDYPGAGDMTLWPDRGQVA